MLPLFRCSALTGATVAANRDAKWSVGRVRAAIAVCANPAHDYTCLLFEAAPGKLVELGPGRAT